jgi:hypothetical protein
VEPRSGRLPKMGRPKRIPPRGLRRGLKERVEAQPRLSPRPSPPSPPAAGRGRAPGLSWPGQFLAAGPNSEPPARQPGVVALRSHVNGNLRLTGNQQRFVAKLFGSASGLDAGSEQALAAVASGEYIHAQAAPFEGLGQSDGERRLARAARREIADADHRKTQPPHWLQTHQEPEFAKGERQPVERNQRNEQAARDRGLLHADGSISSCAESRFWIASTARPVAPA